MREIIERYVMKFMICSSDVFTLTTFKCLQGKGRFLLSFPSPPPPFFWSSSLLFYQCYFLNLFLIYSFNYNYNLYIYFLFWSEYHLIEKNDEGLVKPLKKMSGAPEILAKC